MKASQLDKRTVALTAAQVAARRAELAIADPDVRATLHGELVKKPEPITMMPGPSPLPDWARHQIAPKVVMPGREEVID